MNISRGQFVLVMLIIMALLTLIVYDGTVIEQQQTLIRAMMHNPSCLVDARPVKLETF